MNDIVLYKVGKEYIVRGVSGEILRMKLKQKNQGRQEMNAVSLS